jgi:F0F1-type ATP synthase assembly protein I
VPFFPVLVKWTIKMTDYRNKKPRQESKNQMKSYAKYTGMAFQMAAVIFLGVFGGLKLDEYLNLNFPLFTIIFSFISIALAVYIAIKDFIK